MGFWPLRGQLAWGVGCCPLFSVQDKWTPRRGIGPLVYQPCATDCIAIQDKQWVALIEKFLMCVLVLDGQGSINGGLAGLMDGDGVQGAWEGPGSLFTPTCQPATLIKIPQLTDRTSLMTTNDRVYMGPSRPTLYLNCFLCVRCLIRSSDYFSSRNFGLKERAFKVIFWCLNAFIKDTLEGLATPSCIQEYSPFRPSAINGYLGRTWSGTFPCHRSSTKIGWYMVPVVYKYTLVYYNYL